MTCREVLKAPSGDVHMSLAYMRSGRLINVSEKASKRDVPDDLPPKSAQNAQKGFPYATSCAEKRQWRLIKSAQNAQKGFPYATPCAEKRQWRLIKRLENGKRAYSTTPEDLLKSTQSAQY